MLSKRLIAKGLSTRTIGKKLFIFESIDSTNACGKTLAESGLPEGTVVVADYQTSGKGRMGRSWFSAPGQNLLVSIIFRPPFPKESSGILTFFCAVFTARALEKAMGTSVECKWPNDILLGGKKCCGILLENSFLREKIDFAVAGIGINVNQLDFANEFRDRSTSLSKEMGKEFDRTTLLQLLLREADRLLPLLHQGATSTIMEEWHSRCGMFGKSVTVSNGSDTFSGTARHLTSDGGLVLETTNGLSTFYAGDVTVIRELSI
jgi:BirA family biotin operon repressor/biotin-[acetyl-CoA-carboxylase] ligase